MDDEWEYVEPEQLPIQLVEIGESILFGSVESRNLISTLRQTGIDLPRIQCRINDTRVTNLRDLLDWMSRSGRLPSSQWDVVALLCSQSIWPEIMMIAQCQLRAGCVFGELPSSSPGRSFCAYLDSRVDPNAVWCVSTKSLACVDPETSNGEPCLVGSIDMKIYAHVPNTSESNSIHCWYSLLFKGDSTYPL